MKHCQIAASMFFMLAFSVLAHGEDETITISTSWRQGDRICFDMKKSRTNIVNGNEIPVATSEGHHSLEIVKADDVEYVVRWSVHDTTIHSLIPMDEITKRLTTIATEHPLEFAFGREHVQLLELRNLEDAKRMMDETIKELRPLLQNSQLSDQQMDQTLEAIRQVFADKVTAAVVLCSDFTGMFMPYGYELFLEFGTEFDTAIPNPMGGEPLPALETWFITEPDPDRANIVTIEWAQQIEPETLLRFSRDMLRRIGRDPNAIDGVEDAMQHIEVVREAVYEYDSERELIIHAYLVNENRILDRGRIETWEWTVVECDDEH